MGASIGVDVGGTFTDLVAVTERGDIITRKVLSTPRDQSLGVLHALHSAGAVGDIDRLVHGTTVVTNLMLERSGARVVLCATKGASDLLELRRQDRAGIYDLTLEHPRPLVERDDVVAVDERMTPPGVLVALVPAELDRVARLVRVLNPECIAIAFLHSPLHPEHEMAMAAALRAACPDIPVVLSSEVLPEIREYERTATVTAEAYARPRVTTYLRNLGERLRQVSDCTLSVMTSSGGLRTAAEAGERAASMALSGPAGGVVGAAFVARGAEVSDALTIDIGGTSADAGLIRGGSPLTEPGGSVAGVPIALPRVLVETVSAGGGSIGWVDTGGALRVGPRSAGADPGPACFGKGGELPTITDAHLVLGHIPGGPISGGLLLREDLALAALQTLAGSLRAPVADVARAMIEIANAGMARALRRVSVERGIDPAKLTLIAFGGGGPLHACDLARLLAMRRILVPPAAGVLSALGLAIAPERRESMCSIMQRAASLEAQHLGDLMRDLSQKAGPGERKEYWLRARYIGQGHEVDVDLQDGDDGPAAARRFEKVHMERFGFTLSLEVEFVSARHAASGSERAARWEITPRDAGSELGAAARTRRGPAAISLHDATLLVREGWLATPLERGGWILEPEENSALTPPAST